MSLHQLSTYFRSNRSVFPTSGRIFYVDQVGFMYAWGTTVPSDGGTDYAKSCLFVHTDATENIDILHINTGDNTSCEFHQLTVAMGVGSASISASISASQSPSASESPSPSPSP